MCTGKCSKFIAICLYPLALLSIICNIFLFFPDFQTIYSKKEAEGLHRLTDEIKYMGGVGGGILVLIPAIHIHSTGRQGCCAKRCGKSFSNPESYLGNSDIWDICEEPENIVVFNIGLFSALLVAACLELLLCGFQVLNGLFGCICGTCNHKEATEE
ncbi:hypothetical protein cypCar_00016683 [Cyprinus carpio]|nr:hypothetical protein cypCar_00016683 [Cyprinus carpio]